MNKIAYISLILFVLTGLFADFIANERPIVCKDNTGYHIPVFSKNFNLGKDYKVVLNPIIRYSTNSIDKLNAGAVSPFGNQNLKQYQQRHFLGTDHLGRDVLAGLIHGTKIALKIGTLSMLLAFIFGLLMSLYPSYYGDTGFRTKISSLVLMLLSVFIFVYFIFYSESIISIFKQNDFSVLLAALVLILFLIALWIMLTKIPTLSKPVSLPLDSFFTTIIKLFQSLPGTFVVLVLISLFKKPSIYNIIIVIAFLKWPIVARYIRAEMLKIKQERFIEASKALGLSDNIIIWRHALPHVLTAVIVALSFGFAGTILLESTLSFLGIGLPVDHVSWGSILSEARTDFSAWWLAIFPGFIIFLTILLFNHIGNRISKNIG